MPEPGNEANVHHDRQTQESGYTRLNSLKVKIPVHNACLPLLSKQCCVVAISTSIVGAACQRVGHCMGYMSSELQSLQC